MEFLPCSAWHITSPTQTKKGEIVKEPFGIGSASQKGMWDFHIQMLAELEEYVHVPCATIEVKEKPMWGRI